MQLDYVRSEIGRMRIQVGRQRQRSSSFNGQGFQRPLPRPFSSGCSIKSTAFVRRGKSSKPNKVIP